MGTVVRVTYREDARSLMMAELRSIILGLKLLQKFFVELRTSGEEYGVVIR